MVKKIKIIMLIFISILMIIMVPQNSDNIRADFCDPTVQNPKDPCDTP